MLSFMPVSFQLKAKEELLRLIPNDWKEFLLNTGHQREKVVLQIREVASLNDVVCKPGWSSLWLDGIEQAVFTPARKASFSLAYDFPIKEVTVSVRKALDSFVRTGVFYGMLTALYQSCIGLHGVTLRCGNQTVILSAPSGTGKTTLARLLEKHCSARIINGDFALLAPGEDEVIFEPTPFCGTSRICVNERMKVDRIVFLGQSKTNEWRELDGREALTRFMSNAFIPSWDEGMRRAVQENIMKCVSMLKVNAYDFAPVQEAAEMFLKKMAENSSGCPDS